MPLILPRVAQVHQRQQAAPHGRPRQPGAHGDLADRQPGAVLVEGLDDQQAFFQRAQQIAVCDGGGGVSEVEVHGIALDQD